MSKRWPIGDDKTYFKKISKFLKIHINFIDDTIDNITNGISNFRKWRKVIWIDKQWDDHYILTLIKFKLTLMEKYFRKWGVSTESSKDADNIKKCVDLLTRILDDDYNIQAFEEYYEKYPNEKDHIDIVSSLNQISNNPQQQKDFKNAAQIEDDLKEKDFDELFKTMRENIQSWWD